MQFQEVISLHNHVVKLQETQAKLTFHTDFEAVCCQHTVYRKVDADFAQELNVVQIAQPVRIVGNDCAVLAIVKIDEAGKLVFNARYIVVDGFHRHHFTHIRFAGGVANHTCAAAHQTDGAVAALLHVRHCHNGQEVADMQAVRRRVDTDIKCNAPFCKQFLDFIFMCQLFNKAAFFQNFISISHSNSPLLYHHIFCLLNKKRAFSPKGRENPWYHLNLCLSYKKTNIFRPR